MSTKKRKKLSPETVRHVRTYARNNPRTKLATIAEIFGLNNASHAWAIIKRTTHKNVTGLLVPLSKGKAFAIVDDDDFDSVSEIAWSNKRGYGFHKPRSGKAIGMHRFILRDAEPNLDVDHANGNPSDNRRANLRFCTRGENLQNQKRSSDNTTGFKGVSPSAKAFRARIRVNGTLLVLGTFETAKKAARAYDKAAAKYFGEFARLNFPKTKRKAVL